MKVRSIGLGALAAFWFSNRVFAEQSAVGNVENVAVEAAWLQRGAREGSGGSLFASSSSAGRNNEEGADLGTRKDENDASLRGVDDKQEKKGHRLQLREDVGTPSAPDDISHSRRLDECPTITETLDESGVDYDFKNWLQFRGETGEAAVNFLSKLIELYVEAGLEIETGAVIQDGSASNPYPDVCQRLPLFEDKCYVIQDPTTSFLDLLVAEFIPFGEEIIAAKQWVESQIQDVNDRVQEFMNFFLPDAEAPGQCIVFNQDMIGIAENPGFPPPFIYQLCNCLSMVANGVEACTVQAYFRGFAMSTQASGALKYDLSGHLAGNGDYRLYDGFAEYVFAPRGDYWASMDIAVQVPKMFSTFPVDQQSLICKPMPDVSATKSNFKDIKVVEIQSALFVKKPGIFDSETLVLLAIEDVRVTLAKAPFKFLSFSVGNAFGAIRMNTENPICQPSGIFASINIGTDFGLGEGIRKFLNIPNPQVEADFGITWLDPKPADMADAIQSIFLRLQLSGLSLMGYSIPNARIEIQYFDDIEFQRRRDWNRETCCSLDNVADPATCGFDVSPITNFITEPDSFGNLRTPQPTLAMFFELSEISFVGGIITWSDILVKFITQVPENPGDNFSVLVGFQLQVEVLYIAGLAIEATIETVTDPNDGATDIYAEFFAQANINVGLGVASCTVHAKADVRDLTFDVPSDRALEAVINENRRLSEKGEVAPPVHRELQTIGGNSLESADFYLDIDLDFEVAEWVEDLAELVYKGLIDVAQAMQFVWDSIERFAEDLWNDAVELANRIGGAIKEGVDIAVGLILDGLNTVSDALDGFVSIFDGSAIGPVADAIGAVGDAIIDGIETVVELGAAIFTGDWGTVERIFGDIGAGISDAFGFSKKVKNKTLQYYNPERRDQLMDCPLVYWQWTECKQAFGIEYDCNTKIGQDFPEEACTQEKAALIAEMETDIRQGDESDKCRLSSEGRNQGVAWVGDTNTNPDDIKSSLQARMDNVNQQLGYTSAMAGGACHQIPLKLRVNELATTSRGIAGQVNSEGLSNECIDFTTNSGLVESLALLKTQASDEMKDLSRGNQGIDKDTTVASCGEKAGLTCNDPTIIEGIGFKTQHSIKCDVGIGTLHLDQIFGAAVVNASAICEPAEIRQGFEVKESLTDNNDGCAPTIIRFERFGIDCCNQKTYPNLLHELIIEVLPPKFTTLPGAIDQTLTCDTNVFPGAQGILTPEWEVGCNDGSVDEDSVDSLLTFNPATCQTTFTRTWTITENGCEANAASFDQHFVLTNNYFPEWDYFPPDITINVFAEYGTDATGFPTVFQKCGASPIQVTYEDDIQFGSCFAERMLTRTFTAVDVCGHEIIRSQIITITNAAEALPLGEKSLASVYGAYSCRIDSENKVCLHTSESCGITSVSPIPLSYSCGTAADDEFLDYQDYLDGLDTAASLDVGAAKKLFECPEMDVSCDTRTKYSLKSGDMYFFHTQQVNAATAIHGATVSQVPSSINRGSTSKYNIKCDNSNVGKSGKSEAVCAETSLSGSNSVYNIFRVNAMDFTVMNFAVEVPSTSIALINVASNSSDYVSVYKDTVGAIRLKEGVSPHNVLWNVASGARWRVNARARPNYSFFGTLLNRGGDVTVHYLNTEEKFWVGQIFSKNAYLKKVNLKCDGHFAGFASCANIANITTTRSKADKRSRLSKLGTS